MYASFMYLIFIQIQAFKIFQSFSQTLNPDIRSFAVRETSLLFLRSSSSFLPLSPLSNLWKESSLQELRIHINII